MKGKKHHSPEEILKLLSEADTRLNAGQNIAQTCQALGVAESTFHRWRDMYGGMKGITCNPFPLPFLHNPPPMSDKIYYLLPVLL